MRKITTIQDFISNPNNTEKEYFLFYDWFCPEKALEKRAKSFIPKLKFLVKEGIISPNIVPWFKNNCSLYGSLFDDVRFNDSKDDKFLGGFCPRLGYNNIVEKCDIWLIKEGEDTEHYTFETWSEFKRYIKSSEGKELKEKLSNHFR